MINDSIKGQNIKGFLKYKSENNFNQNDGVPTYINK